MGELEMRTMTRRVGVAVGLVAVMALSACGGGGGDGGGDTNAITVWTADTLPDRVAATQAIIDRFTAADRDPGRARRGRRGPVQPDPHVGGGRRRAAGRDRLASRWRRSARWPPTTWSTPTATGRGRRRARRRTPSTSGRWSSPATATRSSRCPARRGRSCSTTARDLFDAAGLPAPNTYDAILERGPHAQHARGWPASSAPPPPGDAFTQQTFEHIALANGCQLVDEAGEITIDSPQCVAAFDFYRDLITDYSVPGAQDVDTRARHLLRRPGRDGDLVDVPARRAGRAAQRRASPAAPSASATRRSWPATPASSPACRGPTAPSPRSSAR